MSDRRALPRCRARCGRGGRRPGPAGPPARGRAPRTTAYLRYVAGKLGGAAVSLFAVLVTSFFLFRLIPGDPVQGR